MLRGKLSLVKKFFLYLKDKGLIITFLKVCDYLQFKLKTKKKKFSPILKGKNFNIIVTEKKGVSLYYNGLLLTKNVGFHSAIRDLEKWHDSTQADWHILYFKNSKIVFNQYWWNLPLQQKWVLSLDTKDRIKWLIEMEVENYLEIEEIKVGLLLLPLYSQVMISNHKIILPEIESEFEKRESNSNIKEFILQGKDDTKLPNIKFSVESFISPYKFIFQNTDRYLDGRFIQIDFFKENEYPSGKYKICQIDVELIK